MVRSLPPLNWIRAFEAAARHRNFRHAAEELGVSAGAVSQKIKALERHLNRALFERRPRGVRLTDMGRRYRDELSAALDDIAAATGRIAANSVEVRLRITALPAVAEKWLTPRLPLFRDIRPQIDVEVSVAPDVSQLAPASFDVALHYEIEASDDLATMPLFRDEMFPVCNRELAEKMRLREPADLTRCQLLYDTQWVDDWTLWFRAAGLPPESGRRESGFTLYSMAVEAAVEGLGVAMGHDSLVARDLRNGRLVVPFNLRVPAPRGYAIILPAWSRNRRDVRDFVAWLRQEAA